MISIKNVTKKYGRFVALDNVSLDLPDTGLVALTGENGCGKTTLLNIISTYDKPKKGFLRYNITEYRQRNYRYLRKNIITYVQQDHFFVDYLNIRDNLSLSGASVNTISEKLEKYGIPEKVKADTCQLSGGQKQKCSFVRGIIRDTPVLLVDEPTSSMDKESEKYTFEILRKLSEDRLVIIVSHNPVLIDDFADLIIKMDKGKVITVYDNCNAARAYVDGDKVYIPESAEYKLSRDADYLHSILREKRKLALELKAFARKNEHVLDFSGNAATVKSNLRHSVKKPVKTALMGIGKQSVRIVLIAFFMSVLILISALMLSLREIDTDLLFYNLVNDNGYTDIIFDSQSGSSFEGEEIKHMRCNNVLEISEKYQTRGMIFAYTANDHVHEPIDIGLSYDSEFKYTSVYNIILIDSSQSGVYELAAGKLPQNGEIMLTDYMADQLINGGKYKDYEEIIQRGVTINAYNATVSGIMETGYEKYHSLYTYKNELNKRDIDYAAYLGDHYCSSIYVNCDNYLCYPDEGANAVFCNGLLVDICVLPSDTGSSGVFINEKLASVYTDDHISTIYRGWDIKGKVDDKKDNPTIYVTSDVYNAEQNPEYFKYKYTVFSFRLTGKEMTNEIETYFGMYDMPLTDFYYTAYNAIIIAQYDGELLIPIAACITAIFGLWMWIEISKKHRYFGYALITNGYSGLHLALFTYIRMAVLCVAETVISFALYFSVSSLFNAVISDMAGYSFMLFQKNPASILEALALCMGLHCLLSFVYTAIYFSRRPISIYLSMSKH